MGKISDALQKHNSEKQILAEKSPVDSERLILEDPEISRIRDASLNWKVNPKLIVLSAPDSMDAENFKVLRAHVLMAGKKNSPPRTILVTSAFPGEGKTFVAANLAVSIALGIDEYVLLVDCDLRRPQVHAMMGYSKSKGLGELLKGKMEVPDILIKTGIEKMSIITAGAPQKNPSELLSSSRMESFIEEVRSRYSDRFIILDATPAQFTSESAVLARHVDGILLVVMANKTPREATKKVTQNLPKDKILGIVFNGHSESLKSYKKYYSGYYHK